MEKKPSERINELFKEEEKRLSSVANFANAIMNYLDEEWEKKQEGDRKEKRFQELSDGHKYFVGGKQCKQHSRIEQVGNHGYQCVACGEYFANKEE